LELPTPALADREEPPAATFWHVFGGMSAIVWLNSRAPKELPARKSVTSVTVTL
jgi:hypothetical protein